MIQRLSVALALVLAAPAAAFAQAAAPPPAQAAPPAPALDPEAWWSVKERFPEASEDPLAGRRWSRRDRDVLRGFSNGVDASLYRLWGLQPLQGLVVRRNEAVFEAWFRPTSSTRQAVVRVIARGDGRVFVQARAGRGCCSPEVTRRVDINQELTGAAREAFRRLRDDPLWRQPRHVVVTEGGDVVSSVCVNGASYDLTLVDSRRAVHLRRYCDPVEIGSVAPALKAIIGAALGRDPRFDAVFEREDFDDYAAAYRELTTGGGGIAASDSAADAAAAAPEEAAAAGEDPVAEILAADRAFAARAAQTSAAQAFREFMEEDGLLFRDNREPVAGRDAIFQAFGGDAPPAGRLVWEPAQAWASASGDFGASWGRSQWIPDGAARPAEAFRYLTVWRRDEDGQWRGLMDMGVPARDLLAVPGAAPTAAPAPAAAPGAPPQPNSPPASR